MVVIFLTEVGRWFSLSVEFLEFFLTCLGEGVPLGTVPGGMCVFVLAGTCEQVRRALCLAHLH